MQTRKTALVSSADSLMVQVSDPTGLDAHRGWVLIGRANTKARPQVLESIVGELHRAGLGTIVLPFAGADLQTMAGWVDVAANHLRLDLADDRPIAYLGARKAGAAGWLAAVGGDLNGVMAWNARLGTVWGYLPSVSVPSLLVVQGQTWRRMAVARAAGWRLAGSADVVKARSTADVNLLCAWFEHRLLDAPVPARARRVAVATPRTRVASLMVGAAVAAGPLSVTTAMAALPDFSSGVRLSASSVARDSTRPAPTSSRKPGAGNYRILKPGEIKGDGPIGDPPLTDGIGVRFNINTNVGFTTTSSASGAVSEASFTHAVAATTLNGGTVNTTLTDAFDGYNALCLDVNNVGGQCDTLNMAVYNQNGPASLECSGRQVVLPASTLGNFEVRRKVFVPSNDSFARWLNIVRNTSASTQTVRLQTSSNLGSDALTQVVTTSDGDVTPEVTDTWVTTFQNFSAPSTTSPDVRLGHVLRGANGVVGLSAISFANGDDNPFWRYVFTLAPGQTAIIMNYATGQASRAAAATQAASLANLTNANALACMTATEIGQVLNFKTDSATPICSFVVVNADPKRIDFTVQDTSSGISTITFPTLQNIVLPVVVPPFTVGTLSAINFSAVKDNQALGAKISVLLTDVQGNQSNCI